MSQAPIMPFYTDAYLADTRHLTTEAHGAYLLLLLYSWRSNGAPPPDDNCILARITGLTLKRWQITMRPMLEPFYRIEGGLWHQKRLEATWADVQSKIELQRQKGIKGNWIRSQQANALNSAESSSADASSRRAPSNKPSSLIHHPVTHKVMTPALNALKPILNDVQYFVRGGKHISPALTTQLKAAQAEACALLQPMGTDHATQLADQLWRMYPRRTEDSAALKQDYITWFARLPADVGAECVEQVITKHPYASLPRIADFAPLTTPPCEHRRATLSRVNRLGEQVGLPPAMYAPTMHDSA